MKRLDINKGKKAVAELYYRLGYNIECLCRKIKSRKKKSNKKESITVRVRRCINSIKMLLESDISTELLKTGNMTCEHLWEKYGKNFRLINCIPDGSRETQYEVSCEDTETGVLFTALAKGDGEIIQDDFHTMNMCEDIREKVFNALSVVLDDYQVIVNSNIELNGYNTGDIDEFTKRNPFVNYNIIIAIKCNCGYIKDVTELHRVLFDSLRFGGKSGTAVISFMENDEYNEFIRMTNEDSKFDIDEVDRDYGGEAVLTEISPCGPKLKRSQIEGAVDKINNKRIIRTLW